MTLILNGTSGLSDVDGSAATPAIRGTDANTGIFFPAADQVAITTGGTQRAVVDASGNVGIGTSSIASAGAGTVNFNVHTPSANSTYVKLSNSSTGNTASDGFDFICGADGGAYIYNRENQPIYFGTNNTERMRIDSSGVMTLGTTAKTTDTDFRLLTDNRTYGIRNDRAGSRFDIVDFTAGSVRASIDSSGNLLVGTTSAPSSTVKGIALNNDPSTTASSWSCGTKTALNTMIQFINGNGSVGSIQTNASATSYNTSSDYRLKNTIAPMTGALDKVALLKPVTYKWNVDGSDGQGFIAHELQEVVEGCVTGEKDAVDAEGNPQYQGIDTSFLVATLTAAIQELKALLDTQASTITTLTDRITALEAKP
jgi:hypothetical protein